MSEFESSSPTKRVVAVLRPARTASLSELWKSSLGSMAARFASPCDGLRAFRVLARVGRPSSLLHQTWDLSSSKLLREVPRTVMALAEAPLATNDCAPPGFYVLLGLAAADPKSQSISQHQRPLCFMLDANECSWELYRWLSKGMRLYYGLLRREP